MKNKKGNVAVIAIIIVIVAITTGVVGWMFAKRVQSPTQQVLTQSVPITKTQQVAQPTPDIAKTIFKDEEIGLSLTLPAGWEKYVTGGNADTGSRSLTILLPTNDKSFNDPFYPGFAGIFQIQMNDVSVWKNALSDAKNKGTLIATNGKWIVHDAKIFGANEIPSDFKVGRGTGGIEITTEYLKNNIKFTDSQVTADETANWQTSIDTKLGFEVKYPTNWKKIAPGMDFQGINLSNETGRGVFAVIYYKRASDIPSGVATSMKNFDDLKRDPQYSDIRDITFLGNKAISATVTNPNINLSETNIFISKGGAIYGISYDNNDSVDVSKQILSTFKFTK